VSYLCIAERVDAEDGFYNLTLRIIATVSYKFLSEDFCGRFVSKHLDGVGARPLGYFLIFSDDLEQCEGCV
jgi:hypothetical protein